MRAMVREVLSPTFFAELASLALFMAMLFVWGVATGVIR
jgi:hypothetical protein